MAVAYSSTLSVESQAFPGVKFTLRKMTEARRAEFRLRTADNQAKFRELNARAARLYEQAKALDGKTDPELDRQIEELHDQMLDHTARVTNPEWVRWGLKSITGLVVVDDDAPDAEPVPITNAEELIASGPSDLFAEICGAVIAASNMTEEQLKNFRLPSISGALTDGNAQTSSANNVSSADGSAAEIAPDTSLTL